MTRAVRASWRPTVWRTPLFPGNAKRMSAPRTRTWGWRNVVRPKDPFVREYSSLRTLIRVGNEEYSRTNGSFGLTTLRQPQVRVRGADIRFAFPGKSGVRHTVGLHDARTARVIRRLQDLPGQRLVQYVGDDGELHAVGSADVNAYLRAAGGEDYSAKDFRTWTGTLM